MPLQAERSLPSDRRQELYDLWVPTSLGGPFPDVDPSTVVDLLWQRGRVRSGVAAEPSGHRRSAAMAPARRVGPKRPAGRRTDPTGGRTAEPCVLPPAGASRR